MNALAFIHCTSISVRLYSSIYRHLLRKYRSSDHLFINFHILLIYFQSYFIIIKHNKFTFNNIKRCFAIFVLLYRLAHHIRHPLLTTVLICDFFVYFICAVVDCLLIKILKILEIFCISNFS